MSMGIGPSTPSIAFATTTAQVIYAHPALVRHVALYPGTAACTLTVYDNATAGSGTVLAYLNGVANGATVTFSFTDAPPRANNGITCALTGAASTAQIFYQPEF